jgi:OOP family OmpA-OmpF porin
MADQPSYPHPKPNGGDPISDDVRALQELRSLLFSAEKKEIIALRERLENPGLRARDTSSVIAEALRIRREQGGNQALSDALAPSVEEILRDSIHRNPKVLADVLFPVMGPAIRKSVLESISAMIQSFNQSLEHSLSIQGLKWRIEAIRTGRSFAEVVLLHSLVYRVEQIFLIHKNTSLPLLHLVSPTVAAQDPDMVSGMLSAIQDFVRDSFKSEKGESLNMLEMGGLKIMVEHGPEAILAAVIRGHPPQDFVNKLKEKLEAVHLTLGSELANFQGDASPFEVFRPELAQLLEVRYAREEVRKPKPYLLVLVILLVVLAGVWKTLSVLEDRKWDRYVDNLRQQPGIVITSFDVHGGRYRIQGLRDPLAADPNAMLEQAKLDVSDAVFQWNYYYALDDPIILKRAQAALQPPAGVTLAVENGILHVAGNPPAEWAATLKSRALLVAGVKGLDETAMNNPASFANRKAGLEGLAIHFPTGQTTLIPEDTAKLAQAIDYVRALLSGDEVPAARVRVEIVGHTDSTGAEATNSLLSQSRADVVARELTRAGIDAKFVRTRGVGPSEPVRPENTDLDRQYNRRVSFRVIVSK